VKNPWTKLPRKPPFILPSDRTAIAAFNKRVPLKFRIVDHLFPVPYLGRPDAPILLLNLNPGYNPEDEYRQTSERFVQVSKRVLRHQEKKSPFYFLDARVEGAENDIGPGTRWWWKKFGRQLRENFGTELLGNTFFCVQYFPYRSREFRELGPVLESQRYSFELVRTAMRRKAMIIIMRSRQLWYKSMPELEEYSLAFTLRNPRNPTLTRRNFPTGFFKMMKIIEIEQRKRRRV
jgi:hypothetical protein